MNSGNKLTLNNLLEVFMLFLTPKDFFKFCSMHTIKNKWMWAVDFLFGFYKIKAGVINIYEAKHEIRGNACNEDEAYYLYIEYLKKYTKYDSFKAINVDYPVIYETIDDI